MLHEILVALSGHPSPLFATTAREAIGDASAPLSPSEQALLRTLGKLSNTHIQLRGHVTEIISSHKSTICRAVATSVQRTHLVRFQKKIIDVESRIISKDASIVGAYNIVPLAGVVAEFDDWQRLMTWYWQLACFMQPEHRNKTETGRKNNCNGAALINQLREEQHTGYPEIQQAAVELSRVADAAWLRQLSPWILYGSLPSHGSDDFFVQARGGDQTGEDTKFRKNKRDFPRFVSPSTATAILFVGKCLHQLRQTSGSAQQIGDGLKSSTAQNDLAAKHLAMLSELSLPVLLPQLSRTIAEIKQSLSQNLLQYLLPLEATLEVLFCLKQFFLLSRGDFAFVLVKQADDKLREREKNMSKLLQQDPVNGLRDLVVSDAEINQTLAHAFEALASQAKTDEDPVLDFARNNISLRACDHSDARPLSSDSALETAINLSPVAFNDILLPRATTLRLDLQTPLDLFISASELQTYASIHSYFLAIERANLRLSELWKNTAARRDSSFVTNANVAERQARALKRRIASRKIWATCSAAILLLSETARYFEGEVIEQSWTHFERWVRRTEDQRVSSPMDEFSDEADITSSQRDPDSLAAGHRAFLASLAYALLLTDVPFTKDIRSLLGNVDSLIAFFNSLLSIQQKLEIQHDTGGELGYTLSEEKQMSLELDRSRKKVDSDLKAVLNRLRHLDHERVGSGRFSDSALAETDFVPWTGGGIDRLLMKLEFGHMLDSKTRDAAASTDVFVA